MSQNSIPPHCELPPTFWDTETRTIVFLEPLVTNLETGNVIGGKRTLRRVLHQNLPGRFHIAVSVSRTEERELAKVIQAMSGNWDPIVFQEAVVKITASDV